MTSEGIDSFGAELTFKLPFWHVGGKEYGENLKREMAFRFVLFIVAFHQLSQGPPGEISNPPISAVQVSLEALSKSLQLLRRLDVRCHIPELIAFAGEDVFAQLVVLQLISFGLGQIVH